MGSARFWDTIIRSRKLGGKRSLRTGVYRGAERAHDSSRRVVRQTVTAGAPSVRRRRKPEMKKLFAVLTLAAFTLPMFAQTPAPEEKKDAKTEKKAKKSKKKEEKKDEKK